MTPCQRRLGGEVDGLLCVGTDTPHEHVYEASGLPDEHDADEARAESSRG